MNRKLILIAALVLLAGLAPQLFAQYNRDAVVAVMRASASLIGEINTAANNRDFYVSATKLMELARGFKSLDALDPPKGSKAEWDRIHDELVDAAFRAIGACGARDLDKLKAELATIMALNKEGHSKFRG
jgi:hypothetical protein